MSLRRFLELWACLTVGGDVVFDQEDPSNGTPTWCGRCAGRSPGTPKHPVALDDKKTKKLTAGPTFLILSGVPCIPATARSAFVLTIGR